MKRSWLISLMLLFALILGTTIGVYWLGLQAHPPALQTPTAEAAPPAAVSPVSSPQQTTPPASPTTTLSDTRENTITRAVREVGPSVVRIEVAGLRRTNQNQFFGNNFFNTPQQEQPFQALGSGFVIAYRGQSYIVTNHHVIADAKQIQITTPQGKRFNAKVIGSDATMDIAVLRPEGNGFDLAPLTLGDSDQAMIGEWAIALGNPEGLQNSVTVGVVSALHRSIRKPDGNGNFRDLIQTDAAINPGNSGGPLVDATGKVIGVNVAIIRQVQGIPLEGLNFAIAINDVKRILPQLIERGKFQRAFLGITMQPVTPDLAQRFGVPPNRGVLIDNVLSDTPAARAGLKPGDVIESVGGQPVASPKDLQSKITFRPVGSQVTIGLIRDGRPLSVTVTLMAKPAKLAQAGVQPRTAPAQPSGTAALERDGITVADLTPELAQQFGISAVQGVVIIKVKSSSVAALAGLRPGDRVLEIDRIPLRTVSDWNRQIQKTPKGEGLFLTIQQRGSPYRIYLTLQSNH